jgi:hypothetical protein
MSLIKEKRTSEVLNYLLLAWHKLNINIEIDQINKPQYLQRNYYKVTGWESIFVLFCCVILLIINAKGYMLSVSVTPGCSNVNIICKEFEFQLKFAKKYLSTYISGILWKYNFIENKILPIIRK